MKPGLNTSWYDPYRHERPCEHLSLGISIGRMTCLMCDAEVPFRQKWHDEENAVL